MAQTTSTINCNLVKNPPDAMAKNQVPIEGNRNPNSPQTPKSKKTKTENSTTKITSKTIPYEVAQTSADDANAPLVAPPSSTVSQGEDVVESSDGEADLVVEKEEGEEPNSIDRKIEKDDAKSSKGKKKRKKEDDGVLESDAEEKSEHALYRFPMNRISRIIKDDNPDIRLSQEAVFLINRASEEFLKVFCREAYACLFLEGKSYSAYNHLSSVVAKRKRFEFLSDFVPEKLRAEDALAEAPEAPEAET